MKLASNYKIDTIAGQQVLMPVGQAVLDGSTLFSLNDTGAWYAKQLSGACTFEELEAKACEHFSAFSPDDKARIHTDLESFLASLQELGLLADAEELS